MSEKDNTFAPIPFGIPQLDELLGYNDFQSPDGNYPEKTYECLNSRSSVAIVGQDGTGKSIFALHLAANYIDLYERRRAASPASASTRPHVFYLSSDLGFDAALTTWKSFHLEYPWLRYVPFLDKKELEFRRKHLEDRRSRTTKSLKIDLKRCAPCDGRSGMVSVANFVRAKSDGVFGGESSASIAFVDLNRDTSGDDWLFATRLIASFPKGNGNGPPNLLVVDSVEGFETLVGERNGFGERMSRRARIAQMIRAAGDNWHIVFVVEEPKAGTHHPEEYVTDSVLHLRRHSRGEQVRRTLEIEKCRGRAFGDGEHPFEIRSGRGTSTGLWENPDDPHTRQHPDTEGDVGQPPVTAHIQVFPSLNYLSKRFGAKFGSFLPSSYPASRDVVPFGIRHLDEMLGSVGGGENEGVAAKRGLPGGSVTSLIGDGGTRKDALAEEFLLHSLREFPQVLAVALQLASRWNDERKPPYFDSLKSGEQQAQRDIDEVLAQVDRRLARTSVGALSATVKTRLRTQLRDWLANFTGRRAALDEIRNGTRLRLKDLTSIDDHELDDGYAGGRPLLARWDNTFFYEAENDGGRGDDSAFILALSMLRLSGGLIMPVVLVTTRDVAAERLSQRAIARVRDELVSVLREFRVIKKAETISKNYHTHFRRLVERFIVVRRIDNVDMTAPQLWHIVASCVRRGLELTGMGPREYDDELPSDIAGGTRVVISDLRLVRDVYPDVANDPLFLSILVFRLRRFGVTALIVDSDNGRPDTQPLHPNNWALRSLVDHQIYTWKVPFFGEQKVAITVSPPMVRSGAGVIRELKTVPDLPPENEQRQDERGGEGLDVDPHFELYTGVEEGAPKAVPLQIILYEETPAFSVYVKGEEALLQRLFSPRVDGGAIFEVQSAEDYDGLRDYCHLPIDTRFPYTLVFAVDGYWALDKDASLRSQTRYLFNPIDRSDDVLRLFDPINGGSGESHSRRVTSDAVPVDGMGRRRAASFRQIKDLTAGKYYYRSRIPPDDPGIDRVPFTWDFGFLLCDQVQWNRYQELTIGQSPSYPNRGSRQYVTVGDVWDHLFRLESRDVQAQNVAEREHEPSGVRAMKEGGAIVEHPSKTANGSNVGDVVPWRVFLGACERIAKAECDRLGKAVLPFDLAVSTPDALLCLIFEIWISEILKDALRVRSDIEELTPFLTHRQVRGDMKELATAAKEWSEMALKEVSLLSKEGYREAPGRAMDQNASLLTLLTGTIASSVGHEGALRDLYADVLEKEAAGSTANAETSPQLSTGDSEGAGFEEWVEVLRQRREIEANSPEIKRVREEANGIWRRVRLQGRVMGEDGRNGRKAGCSLQLYKTWLLLLEVLEFQRYRCSDAPGELKADYRPETSAVAARHWYKTACACAEPTKPGGNTTVGAHVKVPVRLPGHFSMRGDWFLAVAKGSRSSRLGDMALDLLTSRRANRTRLELGLGLPVRDLLHGEAIEHISTALSVTSEEGTKTVSYGKLLHLCGDYAYKNAGASSVTAKSEFKESSFCWLFRTGFKDFHRQVPILRRWVYRMITWTHAYRLGERATWREGGGFAGYDELEEGNLATVAKWRSFVDFPDRLDKLVAELLSEAPLDAEEQHKAVVVKTSSRGK